MNKYEFLMRLRRGLVGLPSADIDERVSFFDEMIDDLVEEGKSEQEAVESFGTVEEVCTQILSETPLLNLVKERLIPRRSLRVWEILLLVLGSPLWLSLLLAAGSVVFSLYAVLWSVVLVLWSVGLAIAAVGVGGVLLSVFFLAKGNPATALAMLGSGIVCCGVTVFGVFGSKYATVGMWLLTKKIWFWIKRCFVRKGDAQ